MHHEKKRDFNTAKVRMSLSASVFDSDIVTFVWEKVLWRLNRQ